MKQYNDEIIARRLERLRNLHSLISDAIKNFGLDSSLSGKITDMLLDDKEIQKLLDSLESIRAPKVFLMGRTGCGKSSLINALVGAYKAKIGDIASTTTLGLAYDVMDGDKTLLQVIDSRGFSETVPADDTIKAEEQLKQDILAFQPDIFMYVVDITSRDNLDTDLIVISKVQQQIKEQFKTELPVVVVLNKADRCSPEIIQRCADKENQIQKYVAQRKENLAKLGFIYNDIIAVSSNIAWTSSNGCILSNDEVNELSEEEIAELKIGVDLRYNIDKLKDIVFNFIQDGGAQLGLANIMLLNAAIGKYASKLTNTFSALAFPIVTISPFGSDMVILVSLQAVLVLLIANLSGRNLTIKESLEFLGWLMGVGISGLAFREAVRFLVKKLADKMLPGIKELFATYGTLMIGEAAEAYYIYELDREKIRAELKEKYPVMFRFL